MIPRNACSRSSEIRAHDPLKRAERSNLLQIISPEGEVMNKIAYLLQQAARAERLAKTTMDNLTVERLQTFAVECRTQAKALDATGLELQSWDNWPGRREGDRARIRS
jgi:hypothetical protein